MSVLRRLHDIDLQFKLDLESKFQACDQGNSGMIKKSDFVNVVFESCQQQVQPSELLGLVNLFTASFDEVVNYDDFLRLLSKMGGDNNAQQQMAPMGTPSNKLFQHQQYIDMRDQANSN